ncbi:hypothetical protein [Hymenobacter coccineus]|uniref:hypothetical protein n=1 Tax=Hymenobacter coccineus TaxID=1908235 RepID=UPI001EFC16C3|nr:hypothetical protein [Hymenobacter coccineus]
MPTSVAIIDFEAAHQPAFRALNHAWISRYFTLEAPDHQVLDNPQRYVLGPGGHILMAVHNDEIVALARSSRSTTAYTNWRKWLWRPPPRAWASGGP